MHLLTGFSLQLLFPFFADSIYLLEWLCAPTPCMTHLAFGNTEANDGYDAAAAAFAETFSGMPELYDIQAPVSKCLSREVLMDTMMKSAEDLYCQLLRPHVTCLYASNGSKEATQWDQVFHRYLCKLCEAWEAHIQCHKDKFGPDAARVLDVIVTKLRWLDSASEPGSLLPFKASTAIPVLTPTLLMDFCKMLKSDGPLMSTVGDTVA